MPCHCPKPQQVAIARADHVGGTLRCRLEHAVVVPSGYVSDAENDEQTVTVENAAACDDEVFAGETVSFHNTPLTDLEITVSSQDPGATKTTVHCVDSSDDPVGDAVDPAEDPAEFSVEDLEPDTYTCTIFIDP
jgi:hypothetical protein